jgi:hypothetical protein
MQYLFSGSSQIFFGHVDFFSGELLSEQQILSDHSASCIVLVTMQCRVSITVSFLLGNGLANTTGF